MWTCPEGSTDARQFCYTVQNHADNVSNDGLDLLGALNDCCDAGVGGSARPTARLLLMMTDRFPGGQSTPCIQWCPFSGDLNAFNECLGSKGYGPSYSDLGVVRDTYCVPSLEQQADGANVTSPNSASGTASAAESAASSNGATALVETQVAAKVKTGVLLGLLFAGACLLA